MKSIKGIIVLLIASLFFYSCDEREFDVPPYVVPSSPGDANITIADFIKKYESVQDTLKITDSDTIVGIVTANDVSGNIYKQLVIQDTVSKAAMLINIDQDNIFNDYPVGQMVMVDCKDFYIGRTYRMLQMGAYYKSGTYNQIGRAAWLFVRDRVLISGAPMPEKVIPDTITASNFSELNDPMNVGKLYVLKGVAYADGGQKKFATQEEVKGNAVDRQVYFNANPTLTVVTRNSPYADFASQMLPEGVGNLVGILTTYNGTPQFMLRSYDDVQNFVAGEGNGTKDMPWTIDFALSNQTGVTSGWIQGYIVGTVAPGVNASNPIDNNNDLVFSGTFMNNTVVLAATADVKDWSKCVVVNLPAGSDIRNQVNLVDHSGNLGKLLKVTGTLQKYFGAAGLNVATGNSSEFVFGGSTPGGGDGTKEDPYTPDDVIAKGKTVNETGKWVKGYIVGCVDGISISDNSVFTAPFNSQSNILIASDPNETDPAKCVPVQLVSGSEARAQLNLNTNPSNKGKEVLMSCDLTAYFGVAGIKNITEFEFESAPTPDPTGDGTKEKPYTVADAQANQGGSTSTTQTWTKGYIVGCVKNGKTTVTSAADVWIGVSSGWDLATNVLIADSPDETNYTKCVVVNLPAGKPLRTQVNLVDNPGNYKKSLTVQGVLRTYFGLSGLRDSAGETADFTLQ